MQRSDITDINKKALNILLPVLLLFIGLYLYTVAMFGNDFSKIPGDLGDARFNNYILEHGYQFLSGNVKSFWDAPFMFPFKNVIAFSDNLLGTMPIYALFRFLGKDRETSFQLWLFCLFILNFICCYCPLYKWSKNSFLSATGAYIFTFSIFILGHLYNVQVFPRFICPLVFYWLWKYLKQPNIKYFCFIVLGIIYQFYCGIYLGFLLVYVLMFVLICYFILYHKKEFFQYFKNLKAILLHLAVILCGLLLLAPLMIPYINLAHLMGMRNFEEAFPAIPTLRSYFFASNASLTWKSLSKHGIDAFQYWWCHFLFMGALPWIGILSTIPFFYSKKIPFFKKKFLIFLLLSLFLSIIFSLNINGFTLYRFIFMIPGFSSMRAINRIINTEVILFIVILIYCFNELAKHFKPIKIIVYFFPVLIVIDNLIDPNEILKYDKKESQIKIALAKERIKADYNNHYSAIAFDDYNSKTNAIHTNLNIMLAAQELKIPCVNAYTGSFPDAFLPLLIRIDQTSVSKWCAYNHFDKNRIQIIANRKIQLIAANNSIVCFNDEGKSILKNNSENDLWGFLSFIELNNNNCALMNYQGHYLSSEIDRGGDITATREKMGPWETFQYIYLKDNTIAFKAANNKYISLDLKTSRLIANSDSLGKNETFKLLEK